MHFSPLSWNASHLISIFPTRIFKNIILFFLPNGPFSEWHNLLPSKATKPYPAPWFPAPSVYSVSSASPPKTLTRSRIFPVGVASPTLLCPLWIYPSIFNGQRPFQALFGLHRFHPICPWPMVLSLSWIWLPVPWYVSLTVWGQQ